MSPPPVSAKEDLENTAELPVLDPAVLHSPDDAHSSTDTWAALPQLRPDAERPREGSLEALAAELRAAQLLLHAKGDRITQLEHEREEAHAARAAAEQRASEFSAALARLEAASSEQAARLAEHEQARRSAEQHAAGVAAELGHLRAGGDASAAGTLAELRAAAEQRAARLDAELTRLQAAATQHAARFSELTLARTSAEQRIGQLTGEVAAARADALAATERARQLQQELTEQERAAQGARKREQTEEQARAQRDTAHAAHAAAIMADLHAERARAMNYHEALRNLESRRLIFEDLVTQLHEEAQVRERDLARVARDLAEREARVREQDAELAQRTAVNAGLGQEVTSLGAALAERDTQLHDGRREAQGLHATIARLQAQLEASGERVRALQAVSEQHNTTEAQRKSELGRLLAERVELTAALEAAQASAGAASALAAEREAALSQQAVEHEVAVSQQRTRSAELENALHAERKRAQELEADGRQREEELATVRREMEDWGSALKSMHLERGTYQATLGDVEARARLAERQAAEQVEALNAMQAEAARSAARVKELEADLAAAEDTVNRLESDARKNGARLEELEKAQQQFRTTLQAPAQADSKAAAAAPAAAEPAREAEEQGVALLPDGAARLLIYQIDGREVVHVLARKTSIGRTPDNDLQIDAKFVSRHHAVVLAGPSQTIVEDLNSTNGVQVNGRRVTRQVLQDGDTLAIGRQQYRFVVRKSQDKR
jgi:pSer/pThr/pTyr-binding forkhead associated (FHA) protein